MDGPVLSHRHLGVVDYDTAWAEQRSLRESRIEGRGVDVLLTLEHDPPVLTAGRRATPEGLRFSEERLEQEGFQVRSVERGGEWTFHGPGQLVAYPIVALKPWGLRVSSFVCGLEEAMAAIVRRSLERCGGRLDEVVVGRRSGYPGTWLRRGDRRAKIGAVGVHFRRFVSLHGLALNLDPRPWGFDRILPCGLDDDVTSVRRLAEELGGDVAGVPTVAEAGEWLAELLPAAWRGELRSPRAPVE